MSKLFLFYCINCQNIEWADNSLVLLSCKELLFAIEFLLISLCYNDFSNIVAWKENEKKAKWGMGWGEGGCCSPWPSPSWTTYWQILLTLGDPVADYMTYQLVWYLASSSFFSSSLLIPLFCHFGPYWHSTEELNRATRWTRSRSTQGNTPKGAVPMFVSIVYTHTHTRGKVRMLL